MRRAPHRRSLKYVPRREREQVARDLKPIYTATDADGAQAALEAFDEKWGQRFPVITQAWLNAWEHVIPFLAFPPEVRRVIYTTDENVKSREPPGSRFSGDGSVARVVAKPSDRLYGGRLCGERTGCGGFGVRELSSRGDAGSGGRCRRALGCGVGVVDPGAKRRIWGCVLPRSLPRRGP